MATRYFTIPTLTVEESARFWSHVDKNGPIPDRSPEIGPCWVWKAFCAPYGRFKVQRRTFPAHRIAYVLTYGPLADKDTLICHKCDNPVCVNAATHLFPGTHADNRLDAIKKGRAAMGDHHPSILHPELWRRGETHGGAVLTDKQVEEIKRLYATSNFSQQSIAFKYRITQSYVSKIVLKQTRKLVTDHYKTEC